MPDARPYLRRWPFVAVPPPLSVAMLYGSPAPRVELVPWTTLPERLRPRFKRREPVARLMEDTGIAWGPYEIHCRAGIFFDGPSYPWLARLLFVSRFERGLEGWLGSLPHDCAYMGMDAFCDGHRVNRLLADWCLRDLWLFRGMARGRADFRYGRVRRWGGGPYDPAPELHDPALFAIKARAEVD